MQAACPAARGSQCSKIVFAAAVLVECLGCDIVAEAKSHDGYIVKNIIVDKLADEPKMLLAAGDGRRSVCSKLPSVCFAGAGRRGRMAPRSPSPRSPVYRTDCSARRPGYRLVFLKTLLGRVRQQHVRLVKCHRSRIGANGRF